MRWSPQQDDALRRVSDWLANDDSQVFYLAGYAGTGKTTLAMHLAADVDGIVLFGAFTGKAAYVMLSKGCEGATTIHSMIYRSKEKGRAKLRELEIALVQEREAVKREHVDWEPERVDEVATIQAILRKIGIERDNLSRPMFELNPDSPVAEATLVVIDECSMVDAQMAADLLSFGTKVLVLGDPAQLPPVNGAGYFTEQTPDMMLTEIHRQARDNPIIDLATRARLMEQFPLGSYGTSCYVDRDNMGGPEAALSHDQILVGKNKTRQSVNRRMRSLRGYEGVYPVAGERLVCLRNNHELGLLNGAIWRVEQVGDLVPPCILLGLQPDDRELAEALAVSAHTFYFEGREGKLGWWERDEAEEFDYGYALTVHKSQGSQFGSVLLFDESQVFRADRWRWLYTGITRAADRVTIVKM